MGRKSVFWVVLTLVLVATPAVLVAGEGDSLDGTTDAWIGAFNDGDAAAIAAMMTEDGMLLPPNSPPIEGREAIEGYWAAAIAGGLSGSLEEIESSVSGDLGYKVGTYELSGADGEVVDHGKWIEVWKKIDGEWLMHRDIYNSSVPLPEMEAAE